MLALGQHGTMFPQSRILALPFLLLVAWQCAASLTAYADISRHGCATT
jgi:hypothetical protein